MQGDRFPDPKPACVRASNGLYLEIDTDVLEGDLATVGDAHHRDDSSGGPRRYRQVRGGRAYHVLRGVGRIGNAGPGAPLSRLWTDNRVHRTPCYRPGDNAPLCGFAHNSRSSMHVN